MSNIGRKTFVGQVISHKPDKTAVVAISWFQPHPVYRKSTRRVTKAYAHDEGNRCQVGDVVRIEETRPLSHLKRWRIAEVLERRELPEVQPVALDKALLAETARASRTEPAPALEGPASGEPPAEVPAPHTSPRPEAAP